ncbi:MAG: hypothetical protein HY514_01945 [Candidatus Aenigmarchaeota archaeon]|nr:hypothetical protein [Candidatus Aenigmarchaeota archaeon]
MKRYPQSYSLRVFFPGSSDEDLHRLHHAFKKSGDPTSMIARLATDQTYVRMLINPRERNGHRGGIYTNHGK